jgi:hypothetical protein
LIPAKKAIGTLAHPTAIFQNRLKIDDFTFLIRKTRYFVSPASD